LNDEQPALVKRPLRMVIPFSMSYLREEAGLSAIAMIKIKYRSRMNFEREREMRMAVHKFFHDSAN